jgi:superfamily II helicase
MRHTQNDDWLTKRATNRPIAGIRPARLRKKTIIRRNGTMATTSSDNVDYRLLNRLNKLVICSRCLRAGRVTPIPQLYSAFQRPRNLCPKCRSETGLDRNSPGQCRKLATVLKLRR